MNYQVFKNGRKSIRKLFTSYNSARSAARRKIRKEASVNERLWVQFGVGDITSPNIGDFGYSIKQVNV